MLFKRRPLAYLFLLPFLGCSNDSTSDLMNDTMPVANVTYLKDVKSIIDNNCVRCHSDPPINGAPMRLTTYEDVKLAMLNRGLLDRITRDEGDEELMPQGGPKLPQNVINIIFQWQTDGLHQ